MVTASKFTAGLFALLAIVTFSGCAAMCQNFGCANCGPVAVAGCGDCDECGGCGELYVDPWINHPADCCDPCDTCGNYNGQSCGSCRPLFAGIGTLWGYRNPACPSCDECVLPGGCDSCGVAECEGCCEPGCGCDSCAGEVTHGDVIHDGVIHDGVIHEDGIQIIGEPTYTDEVVEPVPAEPKPAKKIFRPRPQMARRYVP